MPGCSAAPRAVTRPLRRKAAPDLTTVPPLAPLWAPGGERLAYVRRDNRVAVVDRRTGRVRVLKPPRAARADGFWSLSLAWAPSGRWLAVSYERAGTWIVDVLTGRSRPFAPGGRRVRDPAWSPDGSKIAYSFGDRRRNGQIWLATVDGRREVQLTNDLPRDPEAHFANKQPVWSPEGRQIAFLSTRDGALDPELFVIGADGRGERRLTRRVLVSERPLWSPDGRRLAFVGWTWKSAGFIGIVDTDGGRLTRVAPPPRDYGSGYQAAYSIAWAAARPQRRVGSPPLPRPARERLVAVRRDHAPRGDARIVDVRSVGHLQIDGERGFDRLTDVSPDGSRLAFLRTRYGRHGFDVGVLHLGRTVSQRLLARGATIDVLPHGGVFAPDGRWILFRRWARLVAVDVRTREVVPVAGDFGRGQAFWLADGRIAYVDRRSRLVFLRRLAHRRVVMRLPNADFYAPSPDGSRVLFQDGCKLRLRDLDTGRTRMLGRDLTVTRAAWSPDGSRFVALRPRPGYVSGRRTYCWSPLGAQEGDVLLFRADGRPLAQLFGRREPETSAIRQGWSTDGRWLLLGLDYPGSHPRPSVLYAYSTRSGELTRVLRPFDTWISPAFAGPGGWVVFARRTRWLPRPDALLFVGRLQ